MLAFFGCWLLIAVGLAAHPPQKDETPLAVIVGFPIFGVVGLSMFFLVRCPRCRGRLGQFSGHLVSSKRFFMPLNYCPFCGVSFNEPYQP